MISVAEENYLKAVYKLSSDSGEMVSTNAISEQMQTTAASVTDMLKKLAEKKYLHYERYKGVRLTDEGLKVAKKLVRKHRLWEVFLVEKLNFAWDEVHEIAEQLEHIQSVELTRRLDDFLGNPTVDPHGDPIPDAEGNIEYRERVALPEVKPGQKGVVAGVEDTSKDFLKYLTKHQIGLGSEIEVQDIEEYDGSVILLVDGNRELTVSNQIARNLYLRLS